MDGLIKKATLWTGLGILAAIVFNAQIAGVVDPILAKFSKLSVSMAS
jgi:hypothetical protein